MWKLLTRNSTVLPEMPVLENRTAKKNIYDLESTTVGS